MKIIPFSAAAAATLALSGCGLGGPAYSPPPPGIDAFVDMTTSMNFVPAQLTIWEGQTVEWRNRAIMDHTVTSDPRIAKNPADVLLPPGAQPFNSGHIKPGQVYRRTFTVAGDYRYFCIPHEGNGMVAVLHVRRR